MNKETYEALKSVIDIVNYFVEMDNSEVFNVKNLKDIKQVESWIDEVAKEYEEERYCVKCGKTSNLIEEEDMCYTCAKERARV